MVLPQKKGRTIVQALFVVPFHEQCSLGLKLKIHIIMAHARPDCYEGFVIVLV